MKEYIAKVAEGENLTEEEAKGAMDIMLSGDATQAQIAAFLALERVKGETLDELAGFAAVLRDKAETISPKVDNYIDLVGTGGDRTFTFNVSTTSISWQIRGKWRSVWRRPESVSCLRSFLTSPCAMSGRRAARWESVPSLIS